MSNLQSGFCQFAGGSKGNASIVSFDDQIFLIDAGLSLKKLQVHLQDLSLTLEDIDGVFITHEHQDHIGGLKGLYKTLKAPLYCNLETAKAIYQSLNVEGLPFHIFSTNESFDVDDLNILPLSIPHDAIEPVGYIYRSQGTSLGVFTDIGSITQTVIDQLKEIEYLVIEANHEKTLVHQSKRSPIYKERVLSKFGHLSNEEAKELILAIESPKLKKIILTHLSDECNDVELVKEHFQKWDIVIADQNEKTEFIEFEPIAAKESKAYLEAK